MTALKVILVSAMPVIEVRGGLPFAILLGLSKTEALFFGILGNTIGLFMAFAVLDFLMPWLKKIKIFRYIYLRSTKKARRGREKYNRLGFWAIFLLVAIPLPGTGAWTAALVTHLFRFERRRSLLVIFAGIVAVAYLILTVGVIGFRGLHKIF